MAGKTSPTASDDYFIEDVGLFLSQFGGYDMSKHKIILPDAGYSYDWDVGSYKKKIEIHKFEWSIEN